MGSSWIEEAVDEELVFVAVDEGMSVGCEASLSSFFFCRAMNGFITMFALIDSIQSSRSSSLFAPRLKEL